MKSLIKKTLFKTKGFLYNRSLNNQELNILKYVESTNGKTNSNLIKMSDEYAVDVLGSKVYAPGLYVYSAINKEFKEGWIPFNYYMSNVHPRLKGAYGDISEFKPLSKTLFSSDAFPDIAYYINGKFFDSKLMKIDPNSVKDFIFKNTNKVVFKVDNSFSGNGVFIYTAMEFSLDKIYQLGNGVFQSYINQHPFFDRFMPNSVATIRMTTIIDKNSKAQLRQCYLRLGMKNDAHVKAETQIRVALNKETGELSDDGYFRNYDQVQKHPDTNIDFSGNIIPHFHKCKKTALTLHEKMPFAQCIGWDIIVDENDEAKVIEWNGSNNGISFGEAIQGPCFKDLGWEKLWKEEYCHTEYLNLQITK